MFLKGFVATFKNEDGSYGLGKSIHSTHSCAVVGAKNDEREFCGVAAIDVNILGTGMTIAEILALNPNIEVTLDETMPEGFGSLARKALQ